MHFHIRKIIIYRLIHLLRSLFFNLSHQRRRELFMLICLMVVSAFAEVISLGAVLPFLSILNEPERMLNESFFSGIVRDFGIISSEQLVLAITIAFVLAVLLAGGVRIILLAQTTRLAVACGVDLSNDVYKRTLYQPYHLHISQNSSETISGITNKVDNTVFGVLLPLLSLISSIILLLLITLALLVMDPFIAFISVISFASCYGLISFFTRSRLKNNSAIVALEHYKVIKVLQEGLGGIRDVTLDGTQRFYCDIYRKADQSWRQARGNNIFIAGSPRFVVETIGIVLIAILAYHLSFKEGGFSSYLALLGALALGAQRLLPTLQQIFSSWASILGSEDSLIGTLEMLKQPLLPEILKTASKNINFNENIKFNNIRFRYGSNGPWIIDGLNFTIPKGARVGFVGKTGSGKSTILDLLMGLLTPNEGELLIDNQVITGNLIRSWQLKIAHVPQNIFLADSTLAENIAFGVPTESINMARVRKAAKQAQINKYIESCPQKYNTLIGENGIRLSGGQHQRIGIARALYKQAAVLLFDEATSALDNITEESVMESIDGLNKNLTIILITHRLTTLRRCDIILELKNGRILAHGNYEKLLESNP